MKLFKFLWIMLVITALLSSGVNALTNEISPSIDAIRAQTTMKKCSIVGKNVYFNKADFTEVIGTEFNYITITKLPEKDDGVLTISGVNLIEGQTISAENLDNLKFVPSSNQVVNVSTNTVDTDTPITRKVSFTFVPSAKGWDKTNVKCEINILPTLNFAPIASEMSIKTSSDVSAFCNVNAYDPDDDLLSVTIEKYPKNGSVKIDADNKILYTPIKGYSGKDSFVYYVTDEYGNRSASVSASVDVSDKEIFFEDMKDDPRHYAAIRMSTDNIMTYAEKNGKYYFMPDEEVNRIDFTVMVLCASSLDYDVKWLSDTAFNDDSQLSAGRKAYLALAHSLDIITNTNGYFLPFEGIKRCDAAEMIKRALKIDDKTLDKIISDKESDKVLTRSEVAEILYNIKQYTGK